MPFPQFLVDWFDSISDWWDIYEKVPQEVRPEPRALRKYPEMRDRDTAVRYLLENQERFSDKEFWSLLGRTWIICKRGQVDYEPFRELFNSQRSHHERIMTKRERRLWRSLPGEITVYRGCGKGREEGLSWTRDLDMAKWFARQRYPFGPRLVLTGTCCPRDAIAYFPDYDETEVLIFPSRVTVTNRDENPL